MIKIRSHLYWAYITGLLVLIVATACLVSITSSPSIQSPVSTLISTRTATRPLPTDEIKPTTSVVFPTTTPMLAPSPAQPTYTRLVSTNLHLLTPIGKPVKVIQPMTPAGRRKDGPRVVQMIFRADGVWVADVPEPYNQIRVQDMENSEIVATLIDKTGGDKNFLELLVASPDGRFLAAVSPNTNHISLWDLDRMEKKADLEFKGYQSLSWAPEPVTLTGSFSSDGKYLAVAGCRQIGEPCLSSGVTVYEIADNKIAIELVGRQSRIADIRFQPDTWRLVMAGQGEALRDSDLLVWDVEKNVKVAEVSLGRDANIEEKIAFNSSGSIFASYVLNDLWLLPPYSDPQQQISFWDTQNWTITDEIPIDRRESCSSFTFIPGSEIIAYISLAGNPPEQLAFIEPNHNSVVAIDLPKFSGETGNIFASPDGRFLYIYDMAASSIETGEFTGAIVQQWGVPGNDASLP